MSRKREARRQRRIQTERKRQLIQMVEVVHSAREHTRTARVKLRVTGVYLYKEGKSVRSVPYHADPVSVAEQICHAAFEEDCFISSHAWLDELTAHYTSEG